MNHFWTVCFADEALRRKMALKYISQMRTEYPYWYLWFEEYAGTFKLELRECTAEPEWDWHAAFRVKYFPRPAEPLFQGLSLLEQLCRQSEMFASKPAKWEGGETGCACHGGIHHHEHEIRFADLQGETGAPVARYADDLPADFFLAGQLNLRFKAGTGSEAAWESLSVWRVRMTENYYMPDADGNSLKVLRKGDIDRDFPGWQLTDFVATRFCTGWTDMHGYAQVADGCDDQPGVEFLSDGRRLEAVPSSQIRRYSRKLAMRPAGKEG